MSTLLGQETFGCGHPRTPENSYRQGRGERAYLRCRTCTLASTSDYRRRKAAGEPLKPNFQAAKTECKNGHAFTPSNTYVNSLGHRGCRACRREYMSGYKTYLRRYKLRKKYRLTSAQRSAMLVEQDGLCAICYEEPATHVDHDHETGRVRGLLCANCNKGLGLFRENIEALRFAAEYLEGE